MMTPTFEEAYKASEEFDNINLTLEEAMKAWKESENRRGKKVDYQSEVKEALMITDDKERKIASAYLSVLPITASDDAYAKRKMEELEPSDIKPWSERALQAEHAVMQIVGARPSLYAYDHFDFLDCAGEICDVKCARADLTKELSEKFKKHCVFQVQEKCWGQLIYFVLIDDVHRLLKIVGYMYRKQIEEFGELLEPGEMTPYGQPNWNKQKAFFVTVEDILKAKEWYVTQKSFF